jgi:hypothetical protein
MFVISIFHVLHNLDDHLEKVNNILIGNVGLPRAGGGESIIDIFNPF